MKKRAQRPLFQLMNVETYPATSFVTNLVVKEHLIPQFPIEAVIPSSAAEVHALPCTSDFAISMK